MATRSPGRPPGSKNNVEASLFKKDVRRVYEELGYPWLLKWAKKRPTDFVKIIASLEPKEISGPNGGPIKTDDQSVARLFTAFKQRPDVTPDPLNEE